MSLSEFRVLRSSRLGLRLLDWSPTGVNFDALAIFDLLSCSTFPAHRSYRESTNFVFLLPPLYESSCYVCLGLIRKSLPRGAQVALCFTGARSWTSVVFICIAASSRTHGCRSLCRGYVGIHSSGFRDFLLKPELLRAIVDCGFEHPSEGVFFKLVWPQFWKDSR